MKPKVTLSTVDAQRLEALLDSLPQGGTGHSLRAEIERAEIVEPAAVPANVVTMNSTVRFRVADSNEVFERTLVYPKDAATTKDAISVLAPVGSALLGLAHGAQIDWPAPDGRTTLRVTLIEVTRQPEREGQLHR